MRNVVIFLIVILQFSEIQGQPRFQSLVYQHVNSVLTEKTNLEDICRKLSKPFDHDSLKIAQSIFAFVKLSIQYDWGKYLTAIEGVDIQENTVEQTLNSGKGIAIDYCKLFQHLLKLAGIESVIVNGRIKQKNTFWVLDEIRSHQWNTVRINNQWLLMDVTLASMTMVDGDSSDFYFGTPPAQFIYTHYPDKHEFQYITPQIKFEWFKQSPFVLPLMFSYLDGAIPLNGKLTTKERYVDIPAFIRSNDSLAITMEDTLTHAVYNPQIKRVEAKAKRGFYRVVINSGGYFILRIGVRKRFSKNLFKTDYLIIFTVEATIKDIQTKETI